MGLDKKQSSKFQKLANVPEKEFEHGLNLEGAIPSVENILSTEKTPKRTIDRDALYLCGELGRMEKRLFNRDIRELLNEMTEHMREETDRIIPLMIQWLGGW